MRARDAYVHRISLAAWTRAPDVEKGRNRILHLSFLIETRRSYGKGREAIEGKSYDEIQNHDGGSRSIRFVTYTIARKPKRWNKNQVIVLYHYVIFYVIILYKLCCYYCYYELHVQLEDFIIYERWIIHVILCAISLRVLNCRIKWS